LNLPDTLNFELADEDLRKLTVDNVFPTTPRTTPAKRIPKPNLLEGLQRNPSSSPPSVSASPTKEFPPTGPLGSRREFFANLTNALEDLDPDGGRPQFRRRLTQPPSRATSPPHQPIDMAKAPGIGPARPRKRGVTISDKLFSNAKWTAEKQQFGVNGGLINAVNSAKDAGALKDFKWVGTLGMVYSILIEFNL